jgi:carboxylesterase
MIMPQPGHLDPRAYSADSSVVLDGAKGTLGALLIHGHTGSVVETRPMGEYLAGQGFSIRCPLLPGHGTVPQDLTRIRWEAWADEVESALRDLQSRCEVVFVGGLSLGSLLALWLGARHPGIAGLIPMSPAIKVTNRMFPLTLALRYAFKYSPFPLPEDNLGDPEAVHRAWHYDEQPMRSASEVYLLQRRVRSLLPTIRQPILIFQGRRDPQLDPQAAQIVYDGVSSTDKTVVWLENSGHNLLIDGEREAVWQQSCEWMTRLSGQR